MNEFRRESAVDMTDAMPWSEELVAADAIQPALCVSGRLSTST